MKDRKMIELLIQKEEAGMSELLIHYGPLMRYIIAPILPNAQDREDCLSEVAMQVWKNIGQYDPAYGSWNAWLTAVSRNHALNYRRRLSAQVGTEEIPQNVPSPEPEPEEQMIRKERQTVVSLALQRLSAKDRALFYRKYYYMQSTAQIASETGMTSFAGNFAVSGRFSLVSRKRCDGLPGCNSSSADAETGEKISFTDFVFFRRSDFM